MELINVSRMQAGYTTAVDSNGREHLVVVVKGTFSLPQAPGRPVPLHDSQVSLIAADVFTGEPGATATRFESDFAMRKRACDVLLVGSAHAPGGRPATEVIATLQVGDMEKSVRVVGDRQWTTSPLGASATAPRPFQVMPIGYDNAFGGIDARVPDAVVAFEANPVGKGFARGALRPSLDGRPLPNCEAVEQPVKRPDGDYTPAAFGPVGRGWLARRRLAGTYDADWLEQRFPFLPADFDEGYFQSAPADQQLSIPTAPLKATLSNLTADGRRSFEIPFFNAPIHFFPRGGGRDMLAGRLDTIVFEPDDERLTVCWRACRPLRRDVFEIAQVQVGGKGREFWLADDAHRAGAHPPPLETTPA